MSWPGGIFQHLKPKVSRTPNGSWLVLSRKHGSTRTISRHAEFDIAVQKAIEIFRSRVVGRAIRYERLRKLGVKEAQ